MRDSNLRPPLPRAEPRIRVLHEDITIDSFGWLRNHQDPDIFAYFEAENSYAEQATAHLAGLKAELGAEIEGRHACGGAPPPFQVGLFEYFQTHERGLPHPAWWRRPMTGGPAELVLDANMIPGAEVFYSLGVFEPSDDGRYVAFSFDLIGDEGYELRVRDVTHDCDVWRESGRAGRVVWAADNRTLFFTRERTDRRHHDRVVRLDVEVGSPEVVFEEANERLAVLIRRSASGAWLFLDVVSTTDSAPLVQRGAVEVWCLPADKAGASWRRIARRELGHKIYSEHWGDSFLFRVNDVGECWRLVRAPIEDPSPSRWDEIVPHRSGVMLEEIHVLEQHLVLLERVGLSPRLAARDGGGRVSVTIVPDESSCTVKVGLSAGGRYSTARHVFRSHKLIYSVSSFVTPDTVVEHDLAADRSAVLYQARIAGYDPAH
ncbi:hypothetical protein [Phyllobacterium zundukense]|uniref:Uncharacterized protein n=1 Tax=Phyllobacterium zundukense TaxID=1867719 RepID=A0ACD4CVW8_9HYPH|nr:hypothetical protein [Phyllobacterium zundukense]UXN57632.1 hypothetical protein N8E88_02085 [Phyllobacterium zundukense]